MRVLLSGGGTAGHINPAIAIADYISARERVCEILFIGNSNNMESRLVKKAGYEIKFINIRGLRRKITPENLKTFAMLVRSFFDARRMILDFAPDIVIGTGGYVCAPVVMAAASLRIPTIIHEQNVIPGLTVRALSRVVSAVAISFEETAKKISRPQKCALTGNPVRESLFALEKAEAKAKLGLGEAPLILMFGGSLGAEKLNDALIEMLAEPGRERYSLIAATGEAGYEKVMEKLGERGIKLSENKRILPYIDEMDIALPAANLVISRAGAGTISEITALGKPAILIPSPNVVNDHQTKNARYMERQGAAILITEADIERGALKAQIEILLNSPAALLEMARLSAALGKRGAAGELYALAKRLMRLAP